MKAVHPIPWRISSELGCSEESTTASTFHSFFDNAPIAVARCNGHGLIVEMNAAFKHHLGPELIDQTGLRLCDFVAPEDRDNTDFLLQELMECERDHIQLSMQSAGDVRGALDCVAWRQSGPSQRPEAPVVVAGMRPIGDSKGHAESLLQAQRWEAIGRLTGGVVHDFNNLLTGIMLYCDLLRSALDARDLRKRYAEEIRSAIVAASGLVRQLLVFARPQRTAASPVSLNGIAQGMRDLLLRLAGDNISLELHLDPQLGLVEIARSQIQQVLLNLVLNARDAMPEGGRISIETSNASFQPIAGGGPSFSSGPFPCILLSVTDNGRGMDAETRRRLFEPFFTTKSEKANGLGLTTIQSIISSHRGLIHLESEPDIGTRAMILLPRAVEPFDHADSGRTDLQVPSAIPLQEVKKEPHL
ncbi:MAG: ATP-binding protein [Candidatus Sulfotelmatobacter sp.]